MNRGALRIGARKRKTVSKKTSTRTAVARADSQQQMGMPHEYSKCHACGMVTMGVRDYHPYAACVMFRHLGQGEKVEANLRAVVEYGMRAQEAGIPIETAMRDITAMRHTTKLTPLPPSVRSSAKRTLEYEQDIERARDSGSCGCSAWFGTVVQTLSNRDRCLRRL